MRFECNECWKDSCKEVGPCGTFENIILVFTCIFRTMNKLSNVYEILSSVASNVVAIELVSEVDSF
jgi:hypothetical protein